MCSAECVQGIHLVSAIAGPAINHFQQVESQGAIFWVPLLLAIGISESYRVAVGWNDPTSSQFYSLRDVYEPCNLGFDPLGLLPEDPQEKYDMQTKEINNGRLAMIAVAGFVAQELRDGQPIFNSLGGRVLGTVEKTKSQQQPYAMLNVPSSNKNFFFCVLKMQLVGIVY